MSGDLPNTDKPSGDISLTNRRDFFKFGGVAAVFSMLSCMQRPAEKIVPYLNQPEGLVPGVAEFYASTCGECPAGCGLIAKVREGRPVKLEGNPAHPLNRGRLCIRGQASLFNLYDPGRLAGPVFRDEDGSWQAADFGALDVDIAEKMGTGGEVLLITGSWTGPARKALLDKFLGGFQSAKHVSLEPLTDYQWQGSVEKSFGWRSPPLYRFDRARQIVLLGSDPLAISTQRMMYLRDFASRRDPEGEWMSRVVSFEPVFSESGSMADIRYPVRTADLYKIAGALARIIVYETGYLPDGGIQFKLDDFNFDQIEQELNLPRLTIGSLAARLLENRGKCLLVSENFSNQGANGRKLHALVNLLNDALDAPGNTLITNALPETCKSGGPESISEAISRMRSGKVETVIVAGTNPEFVLPPESGFAEALAAVPVKIALTDRIDETAALCDYVLPTLHAAESWNDTEPLAGVYSLQQPLITPIWVNRQLEQSLINIGYSCGNTEFAKGETAIRWSDMLKDFWRGNIYPASGAAGDFESWWVKALQRGVAEMPATDTDKQPARFSMEALAVLSEPDKKSEGFELRIGAGSIHLDGRSMNNAWLLETPQPVTRVAWENYLSIASSEANKMGVEDGDIVSLSVNGNSVQVPVLVQPGMAAGVAAIDLGWGHRSVGEMGNGHGVDAFALAKLNAAEIEYTLTGATLTPTGNKIRLASVQRHSGTEHRPIVFSTTLEEFHHDPESGQFSHAGHDKINPTLDEYSRRSIWGEDHAYPGHRWAMAVDLNKCTGCGACTVGCMAENNIPVVGKQQMLNGREMHWIRIDRYYSGDPENPQLVNQPMLCQHCMNAPCETVCPVVATVHNDEGLNLQIYNRCVGTRYCSNNCPYKVRRFNWHEYALEAFDNDSMRMTLNPDVTVREKGVMEKCTFCLQRIREARYKAKERGVPIADGEVQPACVQTCPTGALVFGDLNNPKSKVHKLYFKQRAFRALEELNVVPSVGYLTQVLNRPPTTEEEQDGEHHG
jgi:Fe-S-cluster-containing dehydrogenase component/anaerobic selenocysteine-containing dehydrogenase